MTEIERKFLVREIPDIPILRRYSSERYFLTSESGVEERISQIGDRYFYDYKEVISVLERTRHKNEISLSEFNTLKERSYGSSSRETLVVSDHPRITIQIYKGKHTGLVRAEAEFNNEDEAMKFKPYEWMHTEITGTAIARDSSLIKLNIDEFMKIVERKGQL